MFKLEEEAEKVVTNGGTIWLSRFSSGAVQVNIEIGYRFST
jgi:hypothetical protein